MDIGLDYSKIKADFDNNIWTTEYGHTFPMNEMTDEYLDSVIEFINKSTPDVIFGLGLLWRPKLIAEQKRREALQRKQSVV